MDALEVSIDTLPKELSETRASRGLWGRKRPAEGEFGDHAWDRSGQTRSEAEAAQRAWRNFIVFAVFIGLCDLAVVFGKGEGDVGVAIFVLGIFNMIAVGMGMTAQERRQRADRFGDSRLDFTRFPYRPGQAIDLVWHVPTGLSEVKSGRFILRCVREWYEETKDSDGTSTRTLKHMALWQATARITKPCATVPGEAVPLRFEPPADLPGTALEPKQQGCSRSAHFWELDVKVSAPDLPFHVFYLIPVY